MKKAIISLLCVLHFCTLTAQTIEGSITDSNRQPVAYANIVALHPADSSFIQGTVSNENGTFSLPVPDKNTCIIKVSCIGYQTIYRNGTGKLGSLILQEDVHLLEEIEIKGKMPTFQLKGDKLVTQVQGTLLSRLGSANNVLERIPSVEGRGGKFTVFGKGTPDIYINGRKIYDITELEKITADNIRSVDLINNPGAEYDATVKAVIKIQLIRKQGDGFGIQASSQLSQAHRTSHYQQLNLNYRHHGLDIFTRINFQQWKDWQQQENNLADNDRIITSQYEAKNDLYALKLILSHPAGKGTLKAGTELSRTTHNDSYLNPEQLLPDSKNRLQEAHSAVFVSYDIPLHSWQLSAGLRYEHIRNRYYVDDIISDTQSRTYDNIFPNLSLSKSFGKIQTSVSYTAKTSRPSYSSLSSNRQYNDRFTYQGGNPFLQTTTSHDVTLNMSYKWLYFVASYLYSPNAICSSIEPYEDDPQLCIWIPRNVKKKQDIWIMLSASPVIGCWHPTFSASLIRQYMDKWTHNPDMEPYHPRLYAGMQNMFNLPHRFILNIDGMCKSNTYEGKSWRPGYGSIHAGLTKSFLKNDALSVQVRAYDLLKAFRSSSKYYADTITFDTWNYSDTRSLTVTVRYKFNSTNNKYRGTGAGNTEKSRL